MAGPVTSVAFSPGGTMLATGGGDGTAGCGMWPATVSSGTPLTDPAGPDTSVAFIRDGAAEGQS